MMVRAIKNGARTAGLLTTLCACGAPESDTDTSTTNTALADSSPAVVITAPATGDTVEGTVHLVIETRNVMIRPAGTDEPGTGHHHIFIDRDLTPVGEPIPTEDGIVHLGMGQTEYTLEDLAPGDHVIIAVVGDYQHVRLGTVATDTVRVTVAGT